MALASLTLYSEHGSARPEHHRLIEHLGSIGLIGKACGPASYLSGPRFFHHITFLGCAPNLTLDPAEGDDYLHLEIPRLPRPLLYAGNSSRAPLCPDCRKAIDDWREQLATSTDGIIGCTSCSTTHPVNALNLRKRACYSSCIIRIAPVFESEAVPGSELLAALNRVFDSHFGYAYTDTNS